MLRCIYHEEKASWLSVASSIMGAVKLMAPLDNMSASEVLIRTLLGKRGEWTRKRPAAEMRRN